MSAIGDWLRFAAEDMQMAELALKAEIFNQTCFHAQQCVEKVLKAWLAHHGHVPPRVHQMSLLLKLCPQPLPFPATLETNVLALDRFYIPTRYPDALPGALPHGLPDKRDAEEAFTTANQVLTAVADLLKTSGTAADDPATA